MTVHRVRVSSQFVSALSLDIPHQPLLNFRQPRAGVFLLPSSSLFSRRDFFLGAKPCISCQEGRSLSAPQLPAPPITSFLSPQAISTVGAILGGATAGLVSDLLGRTRALSCACAPFILGWSLIASGFAVWMLLVGRFLTGVGVGMALALVGVYIAEIAPANVRGALLSTNQLAINIGIVLVRRTTSLLSPRQPPHCLSNARDSIPSSTAPFRCLSQSCRCMR